MTDFNEDVKNEVQNGTSPDLSFIGTEKRRNLANSILKIIDDLSDYHPLTVRQVYYQCVSKNLIKNDQNEYKKISGLLTDLRREDVLAWEAVTDLTRRTFGKRGLSNLQMFFKRELDSFMQYNQYQRCLVQRQSVYIEVTTEKDALSSIISGAIWMYCTRLNVVKGQCSSTMVNDMAGRFQDANTMGLKPVLIHLGDFDPTGMQIPKAIVRNLKEHHNVEVELIRAGLNLDQIEKYGLPMSLDAAKPKDPNTKKWLQEFGKDIRPVELDALHPRILQEITKNTLQSVYNVSDMIEQQEIENQEREKVKQIRKSVISFLKKEHADIFSDLIVG